MQTISQHILQKIFSPNLDYNTFFSLIQRLKFQERKMHQLRKLYSAIEKLNLKNANEQFVRVRILLEYAYGRKVIPQNVYNGLKEIIDYAHRMYNGGKAQKNTQNMILAIERLKMIFEGIIAISVRE